MRWDRPGAPQRQKPGGLRAALDCCQNSARMSSISRRDFLNGAALTIAAGLTPAAQTAAQPGRYPPALTGLRGQHPGSFEAAHAQAYDAQALSARRLRRSRSATISSWSAPASAGLRPPGSTAGPPGRPPASSCSTITTISAATPSATNSRSTAASCSATAAASRSIHPARSTATWRKRLLRELGVEIDRFESAFDRKFYASLGLARGVFFPREAFGRDVLVSGEPASGRADEIARALANARPLDEFIAAFPIAPDEQGATARAL